MVRKGTRKDRRNRKDRRKGSRKNRSNRTRKNMRGGGWGFTGTGSIPGTPGTVSNPQVFTAIGDCRAAKPDYWIPQSSYSTYQTGLPGMKGGKRSRKLRKLRKNMKGGRYTFDLSSPSVDGVSPNAAAWWAGTYPPVERIACEGSTPNPLNPGPHTPSTQPLPVASSNLHLNPQSGGAQQLAPMSVGVGNVDSMYYYGPTAGYANQASTWVDSVGAPVQIQIPYAARAMNQACLTTGGHPPLTGALQKGGGFFNVFTGIGNTIRRGAKGLTNRLGITQPNVVMNTGAPMNLKNGMTNTNANQLPMEEEPTEVNTSVAIAKDDELPLNNNPKNNMGNNKNMNGMNNGPKNNSMNAMNNNRKNNNGMNNNGRRNNNSMNGMNNNSRRNNNMNSMNGNNNNGMNNNGNNMGMNMGRRNRNNMSANAPPPVPPSYGGKRRSRKNRKNRKH